MFRQHRSSVLAVPVVAAALLLTSACGESNETPDDAKTAVTTPTESTSPAESPSPTPSPTKEAGKVVEITFAGGEVTPQGKTVQLGRGETLTLKITADAPGELHVHSSPEREIAYPAGTSEATFETDRPGVVEVESHDLHKLILQLEVR